MLAVLSTSKVKSIWYNLLVITINKNIEEGQERMIWLTQQDPKMVVHYSHLMSKHKLNNVKTKNTREMIEITLLICRNVYNIKLDEITRV
jgi:hypothetical protein